MISGKSFLYAAMVSLLLLCSCEQKNAPSPVFGLADISLGCTADCPPPIPVYKHPDRGAETLGSINPQKPETWPAAEEFEYETAGLLVHGSQGDWYAVTLKEQEGWIYKDAVKGFYPYPEILKNKLAYRIPQCCIYTKPSTARDVTLAVESSSNQSEEAIEVLDVRLVDGMWWINANILSDSPCTTPNAKVVTTGWFPAIKDGKRTSWFHSRGC